MTLIPFSALIPTLAIAVVVFTIGYMLGRLK
jgi:hypothetical protein